MYYELPTEISIRFGSVMFVVVSTGFQPFCTGLDSRFDIV